ncbi:uncharacterized protein LOC127710060 isoform X3 [Mytilus californianus]|uniref:uncharacterized protein LOC127710060 isoform X3 n=1 Tax=Mytilus californianus TaxID=6549 RepID=UPI0022483D2A|nr:uncharacterized protein LOC127710060 isoform X3 [Mytilus californianus]
MSMYNVVFYCCLISQTSSQNAANTDFSTSVPSTEKKEFSTEFSSPTPLSGMTTKHINQSRSSQMKIGSNKSIAGIVAGIVAGVGFFTLIIAIFIFKRFSMSCPGRKVPYEIKHDEQDYTGNQNVAYIDSNAFDIEGNGNYYTTLGNESDDHNYIELGNSPQSENENHTIEPDSYLTVCNSFDQNRQSSSTDATYEEVKNRKV